MEYLLFTLISRWLEENPNAGRQLEDDDELDHIDYDADGNPIAPEKNKHIDPLPPIVHSEIQYQDFTKNFYEEHPDISGLSRIQVIDLQQKHNVKVSGPSPPRPVSSFGHFGFDEALMKSIRKSEFTQPTPIQVRLFRRRKKIMINLFPLIPRPRPYPAFSAAVTCLELLKPGRVKRAPSSGRCECLKVLLISA